MEQSDDSSLELGSLISPDGNRREGLPHDSLANVGGNEQRNSGSKTVTLLQKLIKHKNHETSDEELQDNEDGSEETELTNWTIHAG
jgi:hypothetical protein